MGLFLTDPDCIKQREYLNIPQWHDNGYLGEGITVFLDDTKEYGHVGVVQDFIQTVLPKSRILSGNINWIKNNTGIKSCTITCIETEETLSFDAFIEKYNVKLINNSKNGNDGTINMPESVFMAEKIKKYNLIVTGAAGNIYGGYIENIYYGSAIMVGSANLEDGKPVYGMKALNPDFVTFHGWQSGTSLSAPILLGQCGLLCCKYGMDLTQEQAYQYLKEHCEDIEDIGKDLLTGWGVPIMGDAKKRIVKVTVGSTKMLVDGMEVTLDQAPIQTKDTYRMLVPLRAVSEGLGAKVTNWNQSTLTATIEL